MEIAQFNRIRLLSDISDRIIYYAVQNGNQTLPDYVDLNCGAVPEGDFDQVIDPSASQQFLSLYTQIAENRFAFAVTELLKMNQEFMKPLKDFLHETGRSMEISSLDSPKMAFEIFQSFILDGMYSENSSETKKIISSDENRIVWEKVSDSHEKPWEKAGGKLEVYYELQKAFVSGLLENSGFEYEIQNQKVFILKKK